MKSTPPTAIIGLLIIASLFLWSPGAMGQGVEPEPSGDTQTPYILSENPTNKVLRLWSPPSLTTSVLYDEWEIYLFGENGTNYKIQINGYEAFNGTIEDSYVNHSYNALSLTSAVVVVDIGNMSYRWSHIIINHQSIDYGGGGGGGGSLLKFTQTDIDRSNLRTALIVTFYAVVCMFIAYKGVRIWKKKQITTQL